MKNISTLKKIQIIIFALFSIPGFIWMHKEFFPETNNKLELIKKVNVFKRKNIDTLFHIINIIDTTNIGRSNQFGIRIWPKHPQFRIFDYEHPNNNQTNWKFKGKDFVEKFIRDKEVAIYTEKKQTDTIYYFGLINIKDVYKRSAVLVYWNKIFNTKDIKNIFQENYEIVYSPEIPSKKDGWIYVIDDHWFIEMDKYVPDDTDNTIPIIMWSTFFAVIILFNIRKYRKKKSSKIKRYKK